MTSSPSWPRRRAERRGAAERLQRLQRLQRGMVAKAAVKAAVAA